MAQIITRKRTRKDGTSVWEYRFEIASVDGKRQWQSKSGFLRKTDAKKAGEAAFLAYKNTGVKTQRNNMSASDFFDFWMEQDIKLNKADTTISNYEKKIRLYIKPAIGKYYLQDIEKPLLQNLLNDMYKKGFARNTLVVVRGILTKSFRWAEDNKYIHHSPANNLVIPRPKATDKVVSREAPHVFIPQDTIDFIFQRFPSGTPNHIPLMLGYKCGLRIGEAFAVQWDDIDFDNHTLSINRQIQWHQDTHKTKADKRINNGKRDDPSSESYWYFSPPKYNSYRTIDIDDDLLALLKAEREKQMRMQQAYDCFYTHYYENEFHILNTSGNGREIQLVCVRDNGEYINPRTMQYTSKIIHEQGYKDFDFHSLRHTHATMLYSKGAPDKYIQHRLGHKKLYITKDVYINFNDDIARQGKNVLNGMF
ncbi:MAG: site-specific integrase [Lachnospiraceae bacterium]|nr:site-specific integrase [Lachnospiraceae bacterium]